MSGKGKAGSLRWLDSQKYLRRCAKENSFNLARCVKSCANGEGRQRGPCNQGWGRGILFLPRHHKIWIYDAWRVGKCETRKSVVTLISFTG
jgi:hypothetical protein